MILRAELSPSVAATFTDPGGAFWDGRVEDWRASFLGTAYTPTDIPRLSRLPSRAVVYIAAPDNIMDWQLDGLRRQWSDRTWAVVVDDVRIWGGVDPVKDDAERLQDASPIGQVSKKAGQLVTTVAVLGIIGLAIYATKKGRGTLQW